MSAEAYEARAEAWRQYICRACGLIYDEGFGDPDSGLAPGTRFEDIPDGWECPICGVTKSDFEPYVRRAVAPPSNVAAARSRKPGVVIVGAGTAGWSVAEALRERDPTIPITIVTGCQGDVYHKPELSVALSRGASPDKLRKAIGGDNGRRLGVRLLDGTFAVRIEPGANRLRTTRGPVAYSHLVIAQGARPTATAALPAALCWRINDYRSWSALFATLQGGAKRVAVVGAGMVGCELSEDLARAGHAVTLLHLGAAPVDAFFPPPASARVRTGLERLGIVFHGSVEVTGVCASGAAKRVTAADGRAFDADVVISAIGLSTQGRLAETGGLAFDRGVVVDPKTLRASVPNIHALGDCISIAGAPCRYVEPIAKQADVIAQDILGLDHPGYDHAHPVVRLKTRSAPVVMHGLPLEGGEWRVLSDDAAGLSMEHWRGETLAARLTA